MKRKIDIDLLEWKANKSRKVLLLRGARQVGKTYSVRALAEKFTNFLEVNFEEEKAVKLFFQESLNPNQLCEKLSAYFSIPIIEGETLLFFDEIQACPEAISSLRFFHEKMPGLHLVAAGSLLELVLSQIPSHGVGRIQSLFMYPMSFDEFLAALDENALIEIKNSKSMLPISEVFHRKIIGYLKVFYVVGGMPEIVKTYSETKDILECQKKIADILESFKDDFAKYKKRVVVSRLQEVFESIAFQAGGKFKYSRIESFHNHRALKDALDLIIQAGLAYKVYHTAAKGAPLGAQIKHNKFKVVLFDTGVHFRILGLSNADILVAENIEMINKGSLAEVFVGNELIKSADNRAREQLYYWHNEKKGAFAEIDYVVQRDRQIIPIEVKSGKTGKMQSMHVFIAQNNSKKGIRLSLENFAKYNNICVLPLYSTNMV